MENASKALLMAASVLIAMMVIGLATYIFNIFGTFSKEQQEQLYANALTQFNSKFTKYITMEDITIYDIISLANYAKDYNDSAGIVDTTDSAYISVGIIGRSTSIEREDATTKNSLIENDLEFKKSNPSKKIVYTVNRIEYNEATGRVNEIIFNKTTK